jgi:hypothetical protein
MSSVCVREPNIEDIKSGKFHLIFGSAKNVLNKCFPDALKYSSCQLRNRLVAFVIDESHVIEKWTGERKIQIQNAHFIFMHVPHNLSDHSGPLSQTIPIFCKRTSKLSCPTVGLSKFNIETDFHVSPFVTFKEALQQRQNSFTVLAVFCVQMFLEFLSNLTLQTCCKQSCVEISRFAFCLHIFEGYYIRPVCINLLHCNFVIIMIKI